MVTWAVRPKLGSLVRTSLEGFPGLFTPKLGHLVRMSLEGLMSFVTEKAPIVSGPVPASPKSRPEVRDSGVRTVVSRLAEAGSAAVAVGLLLNPLQRRHAVCC